MTGDEARTLARRMADTWPNGTKGYIWEGVLQPLDADRAAAAYRQLQREAVNRTPIPGQFLAIYDTEEQRTTASRPQRHGPVYDPADGPIMSRDEYIARLEQRAHTGDRDAIRDLATWRRIIARGGITPDEQTTTITLPLEEI